MKRLLLCLLVWFADAANKRPCDDPPPVTIDRLLPRRPLVTPSGTHVPPVGRPHHRTIGCQVPATPPPRAARAPAKTRVPANATAGAARAPRNLAIGAASTDEDFRRAPNMVSRIQELQHQMDIVIAMRVQAARQEFMLDHMLTTMSNYVSGFAEHVSPSASSSSSAAPAANAFGAGVLAVGARVLAPLPAVAFGAWKNQPPLGQPGSACYPTPPPPPAIEEPRYSKQAAALVKKPRTRFETIADEQTDQCMETGVDAPPVGEAIAGEATAAAYVETQANETQLAVNAVIDLAPDTQPPAASEDFVNDGQLPDESQNID
jgi:hypothetical protein